MEEPEEINLFKVLPLLNGMLLVLIVMIGLSETYHRQKEMNKYEIIQENNAHALIYASVDKVLNGTENASIGHRWSS